MELYASWDIYIYIYSNMLQFIILNEHLLRCKVKRIKIISFFLIKLTLIKLFNSFSWLHESKILLHKLIIIRTEVAANEIATSVSTHLILIRDCTKSPSVSHYVTRIKITCLNLNDQSFITTITSYKMISPLKCVETGKSNMYIYLIVWPFELGIDTWTAWYM